MLLEEARGGFTTPVPPGGTSPADRVVRAGSCEVPAAGTRGNDEGADGLGGGYPGEFEKSAACDGNQGAIGQGQAGQTGYTRQNGQEWFMGTW